MALTDSQIVLLKADLVANTDPVIVQSLVDGTNQIIVDWYNALTADFFCWRNSMSVDEIRELVDWDEVVGMTTNNLLSFQVLTSANTVNPSNSSVRQAFASIFAGPGGATSRTALEAAASRLVNQIEKLLATGTGTSIAPATMSFEGSITRQDVAAAIALP